jgi:DNA-binding NtrC family response regulator
MKNFSGTHNQVEPREFAPLPRPVATIKAETPAEMQPTFTLTFTLGSPMKEISDTVIRTVLQYARGNRLRAAQLLQINPRTIRRRLGKKEGVTSTPLAA